MLELGTDCINWKYYLEIWTRPERPTRKIGTYLRGVMAGMNTKGLLLQMENVRLKQGQYWQPDVNF